MAFARFQLLVTSLIWGSTFVATKILLGYLNPLEVMAARLFLAIPILLIILISKRTNFNPGKSTIPLLGASVVIGLHFIIQITGIKFTTATNTGWIISVTPLVVALFAWIFLREKIGGSTIGGIVIATFGIAFLVSRGRLLKIDWLLSGGDWLVLASAHTWALYTIMTRDISRKLDPILVTFMVLFPSAAISASIVGATSDISKFLTLPVNAIVALLFLSLLGTALAHWFWQNGVAKLGAARAGIFLYFEPLATTSIAVPYLHENFGPFTAIGGAMVLLGVWLAERHKIKNRGLRKESSVIGQ